MANHITKNSLSPESRIRGLDIEINRIKTKLHDTGLSKEARKQLNDKLSMLVGERVKLDKGL
jgi:hypothetical protein